VELALAHILSLRGLIAEESLQQITNVAVGSGTLKKEASRSVVNKLRRDLIQREPRKKMTKAQQKQILESMGIRFECLKN